MVKLECCGNCRHYKEAYCYLMDELVECTDNCGMYTEGDWVMNMRIIERSDKEYMEDIKHLYETEVKPLLQKGYSFTRATRTLGIGSGGYRRKYWELQKLAIADGYKLRRLKKWIIFLISYMAH